MPLHHLSDMTWTEVRDLDRSRLVALLPLGAVEAHGPHLPVSTDRIIAQAMVEDGGQRLAEAGYTPLVLPPIDYTAAPFAADFPGTLSLRPETVTNILIDIGRGLASHGFPCLALANAHLDPTHLGSIYGAIAQLIELGILRIVFPDITRKPWALRLTDEFKSGACHAGRYEGSVVLARRPDLVRDDRRRALAPNPQSLSTAIRDGKRTFQEAGGPEAYFGDPAAASAEEGSKTIAVLGAILAEAVHEAFSNTP